MPFYRKKPIIIEAFQVLEKDLQQKDAFYPDSWPAWFTEAIDQKKVYFLRNFNDAPFIRRPMIRTLEGRMEVAAGDFVIKGVQGELYPCKAEIFYQTYELIANAQKNNDPGERQLANSKR